MPENNDTLKRLLVKLAIDRSEFDKSIREIRTQLRSLESEEKTRAAAKVTSLRETETLQKKVTTAFNTQLEAIKKQQVSLQGLATSLKDIVIKQTTLEKHDEERLDLLKARLELLQAEADQSAILLRNLESQLQIERTRVSLEEARFRAQLTGTRGAITQGTPSTIAAVKGVTDISRKAGSTGPAGTSGGRTIAEQQAELDLTRKQLSILETEYKVQQQLYEARKLVVTSLKSEIAYENQKLAILERQLSVQKQLAARGTTAAPVTTTAAETIRPVRQESAPPVAAVPITASAPPRILPVEAPVTPVVVPTTGPRILPVEETSAETVAVQQKSATIAQQELGVLREQVVEQRSKLAVSQSSVQSATTELSTVKQNALQVEKNVVAQKANLSVLETQLKIQDQIVNAQKMVSVSGMFKTDKQLADSEKDAKAQLNKVAAFEKQIAELSQQQGINQEFVAQAEQQIAQARTLLQLELDRLDVMKQRKATGDKLPLPSTAGAPKFAPEETAATQAALAEETKRLSVLQAEHVEKTTLIEQTEKEVAALKTTSVTLKQNLTTSESALKVRTQEVVAAEKEAAAKARAEAKTPIDSNVSGIMQQVTAASQLERLNAKQVEDRLKEIAIARQELIVQRDKLSLLAQEGTFRQADLLAARAMIESQVKSLALQENQLRLLKAEAGDTLFTKLGSMLKNVMQRGVAGVLGVGGGSGEAAGGGLLSGPLMGNFGQIAGGMFTGMLGMEVFNKILDSLGRLKDALIDSTGHVQILRAEFNKLTSAKGMDSSGFLEKMRVSTRGLVEDTSLLRLANNFLSAGMKVSEDQVVRLIGDTMDLGRAMGKSSGEIANALQFAFLNPQRGMMILARVTGVDVRTLTQSIAGLPQTMDPAVRSTIIFNTALAEFEKKLTLIGRPAVTLPELFQQWHIVQGNLIESVADSALETGNFAESIQKVSKWLQDSMPRIEAWGKKIGKDLGDAIRFVIDHASLLKGILETLIAVKLVSWVVNLTGGFSAWGEVLSAVAVRLGLVKKAQEELAAVQAVQTILPTAGMPISTAATTVATVAESKAPQMVLPFAEKAAGGAVGGAATAEAAAAGAAVAGIPALFTGMIAKIRTSMVALPEIVAGAFSTLQGRGAAVTTAISELFMGMLTKIRGAFAAIPEIAAVALSGLRTAAAATVEFVIAKFVAIKTAVASALTWESVVAGFGAIRTAAAVTAEYVIARFVAIKAAAGAALTWEGVAAGFAAGWGGIVAGAQAFIGSLVTIGAWLLNIGKLAFGFMTPWGWIILAVTALVGLFYHWRDSIMQANGATYSIGEVWQAIKLTISQVIAAISAAWHKFITSTTDNAWLNAMGHAFKYIYDVGAEAIEGLHHLWLKFTDAITPEWFKKNLEAVRAAAKAAKEEKDKPSTTTAPSMVEGEPLNLELQKQLSEARLKIEQERLKAKYAALSAELDRERELYKANYQFGLTDFADYLNQQRQLRQRELDQRLSQIKEEAAARKHQLETENNLLIANVRARQKAIDKQMVGKSGDDVKALLSQKMELESEAAPLQDKRLHSLKIQEIDAQTYAQELEAKNKFQSDNFNIDNQERADDIASRKTYLSESLKLTKDEVAEESKTLEDRFKSGMVPADEYLTTKKRLIQQERDLSLKEAEEELKDSEKTERQKADIRVKMINTAVDAQRQLAQVERDSDKTRLQGLQNAYDHIHGLYSTQQEVAQAGIAAGQLGSTDAQISGMERMKDINDEYLRQLNQQLTSVEAGSDEWFKVAGAIGKATQEQVRLNSEIAKAKDLAEPLANLFSEIASQFGSVLNKNAKSFLETLSRSLQTLSKIQTGMAAQVGGIGGLFRQVGTQFLGLFGKGKQTAAPISLTAQQMFDKGLKDSSGKVLDFGEYLRRAGEHTGDALDSTSGKVLSFGEVLDRAKEALSGLMDTAQQKVDQLAGTQPTTSEMRFTGGIPTTGGDAVVTGTGPGVSVYRQNLDNTYLTPTGTTTVGPTGLPKSTDVITQLLQALSGGLPKYQEGGSVPETGPAILHKGEFVLKQELVEKFHRMVGTWKTLLTGKTTLSKDSHQTIGQIALASSELSTEEKHIIQQLFKGKQLDAMPEVLFGKEQTLDKETVNSIIHALDTYQEGGIVQKTGPALVHAGELVTPVDQLSAITSFVSALGNATGMLINLGKQASVASSIKPTGAPQIGVPATYASTTTYAPVKKTHTSFLSNIVQVFNPFKTHVDRAGVAMQMLGNMSKTTATRISESFTAASDTTRNAVVPAFNTVGNAATDLAAVFNAAQSSVGSSSGSGAGSAIASTSAAAAGSTGQSAAAGAPSPFNLPASSIDTSQITDVLQSTTKQIGQFGGATLSTVGKLKQFVGGLQGVIGAVGAVVSTFGQLAHAQSTGGGIFQGLMGGASLGMQLGGPIGAAIGAAGGAIFGGVMGHKNSMIGRYVDGIQASLKGIQDAVQNGNLGIGQALQDVMGMRGQITSRIQGMAGPSVGAGIGWGLLGGPIGGLIGKGGKDRKAAEKAWKKMEPEINAYIQQLEAQIQKVLKDLHDSLNIITAPKQFQPYIEALDQIIVKYKEYAEAAVGSAKEIANAHLWLKKSLENYLDTLGTQLNDAQQQSIQNAIQLIDLQQQELQLDQQHAQNVYNILSAGVMTRQHTTAQTKGAEIEQVNEQYSKERQNMDQQISLAQYRYNMEQKIFGLSQDRVAMESKLLHLQEQMMDKQVQSITAMMSVMASVQKAITTGASPTTIQGLLGLLGLPSQGVKKGERAATISDVPSQWQEYVRVLSMFEMPDIMTQLQQAGTNSTIRQELLIRFASKELVDVLHMAHGEDWLGNNWRAFLAWVNKGAPGLPAAPSFDVGGWVPQTGPATVHAGEYIFPTGKLEDFVSAVSGTFNGLVRSIGVRIQPVGGIGGPPMKPMPPIQGPEQVPGHTLEGPFPPKNPILGRRISLEDLIGKQVNTHQQIYDLANARIGMEHDLLDKQRQQTMLEMGRMRMLSELMSQASNGNFAMGSIEDGLAKLYELRGRYGSGGFRRETL